MSISGLLWTLKNSIINRLSRWLLLCSYTLTSLSQMSWASLYINTKSTTGWLSTLLINTAIRALSCFHTNNFFDNLPMLFSVHYIGTLAWSIDNWHHTLLFKVYIHVPFPLGPIGCTNKLFDFYFRIQHHIFFSLQYWITHNELNTEYILNIHDVRLSQLQ